MEKFTLILSETQAKTLVTVLDFYSRIGMGQWDELTNYFNIHNLYPKEIIKTFDNRELLENIKSYILTAKVALFNLNENTFLGISQASETCKASYDLQQVIRHALWNAQKEESKNKSKHIVDAQEPTLQFGKEEFATMEKDNPNKQANSNEEFAYTSPPGKNEKTIKTRFILAGRGEPLLLPEEEFSTD